MKHQSIITVPRLGFLALAILAAQDAVGIMATKEYVERLATNRYTRAETDAKIVELAPAPGNYATVSNRAMSALQSHQSLSNYYTKAETDAKIVELAPVGITTNDVCGIVTNAIPVEYGDWDYTWADPAKQDMYNVGIWDYFDGEWVAFYRLKGETSFGIDLISIHN